MTTTTKLVFVLPPKLVAALEEVLSHRGADGDGGNCFDAALIAHVGLPGSILCHGLPLGNGPKNSGRRFWHGWVELERDGTWMVLDIASGNRALMPRDEYYQTGHIDHDKHVWRYPLGSTKVFLEIYRHYGPWPTGWETMVDETGQVVL